MDWNLKELEKIWKKLKVPKKYHHMVIDFETLLNHDINMCLSIREDAGKTTNTLLKALCMWWYRNENLHIIYQRNDKTQIARGNVETLFDTIKAFGYIELLTDGKYNDIIYKYQTHKFYMAKTYKIEEEVVTEISNDYFCQVICLENYINYKSSINDPVADIIIHDEFMDTQRATNRQMIELMNNISTFIRPMDRKDSKGNPLGHVIMLGNNTNKYSFWFEEFCIEQDINNLKFGSYIDRTTEHGTTFSCILLAQSEELKDIKQRKKIHFFGFNTPKMNAFNGIQEWQSESHPHLLYDDQINDSIICNRDIFVFHRGRYIRLDIYKNQDIGYFIFAHYNKKPQKAKVIFTLNPMEQNHVYGFGQFTGNQHFSYGCKKIINLIKGYNIYFASNSVGDLFQNYCIEMVRNKNYL